MKFDQDQSTSTPDGRPEQLGGHLAFVQPAGDSPDDCVVRVEYRTYTDEYGESTKELLYLEVSGPQRPTQLCRQAAGLAAAAAAKLPG